MLAMIRTYLKFRPNIIPVNGLIRGSPLPHLASPLSARAHMHSAAIIGAGPAGLTAVANMLDDGRRNLLWIDTAFQAGRVGRSYREVPSNTKVKYFLGFVEASQSLRALVSAAPKPNAFTALEGMDREAGCTLGYAADLVSFLTQEIIRTLDKEVKISKGTAKTLSRASSTKCWTITTTSPEQQDSDHEAKCVVLATGSAPVEPRASHTAMISLDTALTPSLLKQKLDEQSSNKVAVVGSSHSAILALKNVCDHSPSNQVLHFYRSNLKFAEYKDGWILYDNTGLKGLAADWAKETYPILPNIKRFKLNGKPADEEQLYAQEVPSCNFIVYAIGYKNVPVPHVSVDGKALAIEFDALTGKFNVDGLFGCGIAFPERVTDPLGNVEYAVGFFKFMTFVKKVGHSWT